MQVVGNRGRPGGVWKKGMWKGKEGRAEEVALFEADAPPLTSEEARQQAQAARQQAQAEGLTLRVAESRTGYFGVYYQPGRSRPYQAQVSRGGKEVYLGSFATAAEAALCVARSPEGQASSSAAALPLTSEDALQQAQDTIIGAVALDIIYEAAGAATEELSAEVAAEVMAGIAMGL